MGREIKKDWTWLAVGEGYIIHCSTEEEAKDFLKEAKEKLKANLMFWGTPTQNTFFAVEEKIALLDSSDILSKMRGRFFEVTEVQPRLGNRIIEWSDYMSKEFTKSDLKDGMVVELRNKYKKMVLNGVLTATKSYIPLNEYHEYCSDSDGSLENEYSRELDIVKVYKVNSLCSLDRMFDKDNLDLIWEREGVKEMTVKELEKELGYKIKIVGEK